MRRSSIAAILLAGAAGASIVNAQCDPLEHAILAADPAHHNDQFGYAVGLAPGLAVAGARFDDEKGLDAGAAWAFRFDGTSWVLEAKLVAADGAPGDNLGVAIAAISDRVVAGAPNDDDAGSSSGAAYVFGFDGASWVQEAKLRAADAGVGDLFGWSVAIAGDRILVGAQFDSHVEVVAGSAYVFRRDGAAWVQEAKLVAGDPGLGDRFGFACAIAAAPEYRAIIGAVTKSAAGEASGAAYAFRFDGQAWTQEARWVPEGLEATDQFGRSVAISPAGGLAIVGANNDDDAAQDSGAAYVYRHDGASWAPEAKIVCPVGSRDDWFGWSVAIDDWREGRAVVGAHQRDGAGADSGAAYVFRRLNRAWEYENPVAASNAAPGDKFAYAVALAGAPPGHRVLCGAYFADRPDHSDAGAAYIVELPEEFLRITLEPEDHRTQSGNTATFRAAATASTGPLSHRWRKGSVDLQDSANIVGSSTDTLQVLAASFADQGGYDCMISTAECSRATRTAILTVECAADFAAPFGELNLFDLLGFQSSFGNEEPSADLAPPMGEFNLFDFLAFQTAFGNGC